MGQEALKKIRAACVQISAGSDWRKNLTSSICLAEKAVQKKARLIAFPENFLWRGSSRYLPVIADAIPRTAIPFFQLFAKRKKVFLLLGSLIFPSRIKSKFRNISILISDQGRILADYQKKHLFDVHLHGLNIRESDYFLAGKKHKFTNILGRPAGFSICYDLRFPELYRDLSRRGCHLFFAPANFTYKTGEAHWETLIRARAIENQAFVLAPAQWGKNPDTGVRSYGHTMIVDPWGRTLDSLGSQGQGIVISDLDFKDQEALRRQFPVLRH